jgi:hypothetical protein
LAGNYNEYYLLAKALTEKKILPVAPPLAEVVALVSGDSLKKCMHIYYTFMVG